MRARWWQPVLGVAGAGLLLTACGLGGSDGAASVEGPLPATTAIAAPGEEASAPDTTSPGSAAPSTVADPEQPPAASTAAPPTTVAARTTSTLVPRPRTTAAATEDEPVPVGEVLEFPGIWDIAVAEVNLDAAEEVLAYADINPVPQAGFRYVLVTIEGVYLGERVAQPVFEWAISDGATEYLPSIPGCGVIPDSIFDIVEVLPGQSFRANLCVPAATGSVLEGLELYLQPQGDDPRYFDLSG